jgi:hypothetical protein
MGITDRARADSRNAPGPSCLLALALARVEPDVVADFNEGLSDREIATPTLLKYLPPEFSRITSGQLQRHRRNGCAQCAREGRSW